MYRLYLIHKDNDDFAKKIRIGLSELVTELGIDSSILAVQENGQRQLTDEIAIGIYLANSEGRGDVAVGKILSEFANHGIPAIPVVEKGANFQECVPDSLHPINALSADSDWHLCNEILRQLGLTEKHRRVFVSYRRSDALHMGEQIWETLSKSGFEVFLDRFSIDPGVNFQERLTGSLNDKSFLLLIESPDTPTSQWVDYEVEYARKEGMGILALTWPSGPTMKNIFEKQRFQLCPEHIEIRGGQGILTDDFLALLPSLVETRHAKGMLSRRRRLIGSIIRELEQRSIPYLPLSDWSLLAKPPHNDHVVSITPRPPEVPDLYLLDNRCGVDPNRLGKGILVHTAASMLGEQELFLQWAISDRDLSLINEDQIVEMVETFIK